MADHFWMAREQRAQEAARVAEHLQRVLAAQLIHGPRSVVFPLCLDPAVYDGWRRGVH